uniref:Uncharacterized protein n=1 Tax=Glossina pallidipes TaxID=7398 RepID=A0A1A9ZMV7_GLOPL
MNPVNPSERTIISKLLHSDKHIENHHNDDDDDDGAKLSIQTVREMNEFHAMAVNSPLLHKLKEEAAYSAPEHISGIEIMSPPRTYTVTPSRHPFDMKSKSLVR